MARFSAATLIHSATAARVAVQLEREGHCVLSEREIEAREPLAERNGSSPPSAAMAASTGRT